MGKIIRASIALSLGIGAQLAFGAAPATATPTSAAPAAAAATTAPSCVARPISERSTEAGTVYTIHLKNNCTTTQRVKVVISWWPDSDCYTLSPGQSRDHNFQGGYDNTVTC
jgi:hypothetical protein